MTGNRTGFDGDDFNGRKIPFIEEGTVIDRDDPLGLGRIRVKIPGIMESSAWARPSGGGSLKYGKNDVPPLYSTVDVYFIHGEPNAPKYILGSHGIVNNEKETFPEFTDPDIHVFGIGPFRLVINNIEGQKSAKFKMVREINSGETETVAIDFNYEDNSLFLSADSALGLHSNAMLDLDCEGDVQIKGRKILPSKKAID